jgi:signal transduction histidine kinase
MPEPEASKRYKLPSFSLLKGVTILSLVSMLALPIYMVFFLSPSFVRYITKLKEDQAVKVAQHMASQLIPRDSRALTASILSQDVVGKIMGTCHDFNLLKVRIFFPDGKIFFSSDQAEIGSSIDLHHVAPVLHHEKTSTYFYKKGTLDQDGIVMTGDTVDTHVPIIRNNVLIGCFEIYYDVTRDREVLNLLLRKFYFTLFPIALILFCSALISCRKACKNMARCVDAEADALQKSEELQEKNQELVKLIEQLQERTSQLETEQGARQNALDLAQREYVKREQMRKEFLQHLVQAQEEERARIARELHDETAQTLTAASLNFATLRSKLEGNQEVTEVVDRLQGLCRVLNQDFYRLVHDLRPAQLDDLGLVPALRYLADEGQRGIDLEVTLDVKGKVQRLDSFVESVIFRVVQEALTNVIRHAGVQKATVDLEFQPAHYHVVVRVQDEGQGFNFLYPHKPSTGWGLIGMAERVDSVNGALTIDTAPGKGTKVVVIIPYR